MDRVEQMVYIMDKRENYYKRNAEGQLVVALNKDEASEFTMVDAINRVGNKKRFYNIVLVPAKAENNEPIRASVSHQSETSSLESLMRQLCDVVDNLDEHKITLETKRYSVEQEIVDLEHYLEFNDLDDSALILASKKIQNCRRERRQYKDELARIEYMTDEFLNRDFVTSAHKVLARMNGLKERQYTPRCLTDLFGVA